MAIDAPSVLGSEDYREGAMLRLQEAQLLYDGQSWIGCIYLAGRAAESLLRALLWKRDRVPTTSHDLRDLLRRVRTLIQFQPGDDERLDDAVNEVAVVWRNDLRFTGRKRFIRPLQVSGRLNRIGAAVVRGDPLKANAKSLLEACERIVARGEPYARSAR